MRMTKTKNIKGEAETRALKFVRRGVGKTLRRNRINYTSSDKSKIERKNAVVGGNQRGGGMGSKPEGMRFPLCKRLTGREKGINYVLSISVSRSRKKKESEKSLRSREASVAHGGGKRRDNPMIGNTKGGETDEGSVPSRKKDGLLRVFSAKKRKTKEEEGR